MGAGVGVAFVLGCGTAEGQSGGGWLDKLGGSGQAIWGSVGCVAGGVGGALAAKALAEAEGKRGKLSASQMKQRERSYMIGLALAGCAGGGVLAGTAYAKLSKQGKDNRELEIAEAAKSATVRTYRDPENPDLVGKVTPQPSFAEGNLECRVIEDNLADKGKGEPVHLKYCRPPNGQWALATA
jgi:surface antigen